MITPATQISDSEILQQISSTLGQRGIQLGEHLQLDIEDGVVTASGIVASYYQRQLIVHTIRQVTRARVIDRIEVANIESERLPSPAMLVTAAPQAQPSRGPRLRTVLAAAAVALLMASCSKSNAPEQLPVFPVEGKLTLDGQAAPGAFIVLHPVGHELPKTAQPKARVSPDGTFKIGTYSQGDGAPEGEYVLTAEWKKLVTKDGDTLPGPNVLPQELAKPTTSTFKVKVAQGKNELEPLQLSSAGGSAEGSSAQ